ncbi:hypothetical protein ABZ471_47355 [Streptomyces sp. NPDC005728]|uniref:hypothetical protein n=1 Tax=Streptomyces sp. NPDC005728 TaxID=3157054 RepID=UPI0033C9F178
MLDAAGAREVPDADEVGQLLGEAARGQDQEYVVDGRTVVLDVPGLLADHLQDIPDAGVREALRGGRTIRRG